mgnify:CR=1 FL=1|tara:strand:- start:139 stop:582 length:444 start_codon:yes stop_codon:yes gene_type:complete
MPNTSNFNSLVEEIEKSYSDNGNLDAVLEDAIKLEKSLIKSNTSIAESLFSSSSGSSNAENVSKISSAINDIKNMQISADTSTERNKNTKFSYTYHIIYMLFKIIAFCIVFYFVFKKLLINKNNANGEGFMKTLSKPFKNILSSNGN